MQFSKDRTCDALKAEDPFRGQPQSARTKSGLTQEQVTDRSGLHATEVSRIEVAKRDPQVSTVERLALAVQDVGRLAFEPPPPCGAGSVGYPVHEVPSTRKPPAMAPSLSGRFGTNLRTYREAEGLSMDDLGTLLGFGRTAVETIEQGHPGLTLETVEVIAATLGIDPVVLIE